MSFSSKSYLNFKNNKNETLWLQNLPKMEGYYHFNFKNDNETRTKSNKYALFFSLQYIKQVITNKI